jgi:hypothetical protein
MKQDKIDLLFDAADLIEEACDGMDDRYQVCRECGANDYARFNEAMAKKNLTGTAQHLRQSGRRLEAASGSCEHQPRVPGQPVAERRAS